MGLPQPCRMRWPILSRTVVNACGSDPMSLSLGRDVIGARLRQTNLHQALLVQLDVGKVDRCVWSWSRHARRDGDRVGLENDPAKPGHTSASRTSHAQKGQGIRSPVVDGLIEGEDDEVEVFEDGALLDLMPEEEGDRVVERREDGRQHQLVLAGWSDDVESEVDGLFVKDEAVVVQKNVACRRVVVGGGGGRPEEQRFRAGPSVKGAVRTD